MHYQKVQIKFIIECGDLTIPEVDISIDATLSAGSKIIGSGIQSGTIDFLGAIAILIEFAPSVESVTPEDGNLNLHFKMSFSIAGTVPSNPIDLCINTGGVDKDSSSYVELPLTMGGASDSSGGNGGTGGNQTGGNQTGGNQTGGNATGGGNNTGGDSGSNGGTGDTDGTGGTDGTGADGAKKGFIPGFDVALLVAAIGVCAFMLKRRHR
ncbi:MAG: hypothetical protein CVT47_02610 [Thermoplasmata archaeon HGW-Thermoplasmata-2]|nr:MAG: hypothetical protein CVT47_02610 [Thermoplasmata archaeon HGW-Thermoplasmata-2]